MTPKPQNHVRRGGVRVLLAVQGGYFMLTGIWPILHLKSFELVTGPKTDHWLVQTFGALIFVIGLVFFFCAIRPIYGSELAFLAAGCAVALAICDTVFVLNHVISAIYLGDAAVEALFTAAWGLLLAARRKH
jgi:hypothetical protein